MAWICVATLSGNDDRSGNAVVERRKANTMPHSQTSQMAVGDLAAGLDPWREIRGAVVVRQSDNDATTIGSKPSQELNRLFYRHP